VEEISKYDLSRVEEISSIGNGDLSTSFDGTFLEFSFLTFLSEISEEVRLLLLVSV
jgi:hypothetical protein